MGNKFYSLPSCYWLFVPVALSLSVAPTSTRTPPPRCKRSPAWLHLPLKEILWASAAPWLLRGAVVFAIILSVWQYYSCRCCLRMPIKTGCHSTLPLKVNWALFPARRGCCKPTQGLDQSWWGIPHPSHAGIYKGFISVGIRYRHKTIINGKMWTKETLVTWLCFTATTGFAVLALRPFSQRGGQEKILLDVLIWFSRWLV